MATIFTDRLVGRDLEIDVGEPHWRTEVQDLMLAADDVEIRLRMDQAQLQQITDALWLAGFSPQTTAGGDGEPQA